MSKLFSVLKELIAVILSLGLIAIGLISAAGLVFIFGGIGHMIQGITVGVSGSWTDPGFIIGAFFGLSVVYGIFKISEGLEDVSVKSND